MKERDDCPACGKKNSIRYKRKKMIFFCKKCNMEFEQPSEGKGKPLPKGGLICERCEGTLIKGDNYFKCENCRHSFKICTKCGEGYISEEFVWGGTCINGCKGVRLEKRQNCPRCGGISTATEFHMCTKCLACFSRHRSDDEYKLFGEG